MKDRTPLIWCVQNIKEAHDRLQKIDDYESPRENSPYTHAIFELEKEIKDLCNTLGVPYEHLKDY